MERERRLVFGEDAKRYDRARPSYPAALVDDLVGWVGADARVVEIGCGTGKATRLLAERGMTGVAVEPHPAMAAVAEASLADLAAAGAPAGSRWRVDLSDFETWAPQPADTPADLVASAQAWHWVDPAVGLPKADDLLRPGGWLAVWWNLADDDQSEMRQEIEAVYADLAPGEQFCPAVDPSQGSPFDLAQGSHIGPSVERVYRWRQPYTAAELLDLLGTHSNHRLMDPGRRQRLFDAVTDVVDRDGGIYDYPYVTRLWATQRP